MIRAPKQYFTLPFSIIFFAVLGALGSQNSVAQVLDPATDLGTTDCLVDKNKSSELHQYGAKVKLKMTELVKKGQSEFEALRSLRPEEIRALSAFERSLCNCHD